MSDEVFRALRIEYLASARSQLDEMSALAATAESFTESLSRLRRLAHNLRGSGGFYGFPDISVRAAVLEDLIIAIQDGIPAANGELVDRTLEVVAAVHTAQVN